MKFFHPVVVLLLACGFISIAGGQPIDRSRGVDLRLRENSAVEKSGLASDSLYSLVGFLDDVLSNNPRLQSARTRTEGARARVSQVTSWDDPQIGVEFYATPVTSLNPFRDGMETDYFVQQMIPFFGKKSLMGEAAGAGAKMMEQSATAVERDLHLEATRAYAMLYSSQRRIAVNDQDQLLLGQIIESVRSKYSVGSATQSDVLKAQVELARLQNERSTLEQERASSGAMVNMLRSMPSGTPVPWVAELVVDSVLSTPDVLSARSLHERPEVLGMKFETDMNRAEHSAAQREWYPDFMVRGMYKRMAEGMDLWSAMIGINVPIAPWGIGKYSGKAEETDANMKASAQGLKEMENMVLFEVRDAYAKMDSRWHQLQRYRKTILPQSDQAFQSTLADYRTDRADFLSLLDSYRMLQMFRMEYYMAVAEYFVSVATLERAVGGNVQ